MSTSKLQSLEERIAAVETEVADLKRAKEPDKSDEDIPWWKKIVGIHANTPGFEEAVRLGREWRESQDAFDEDDSA